jgi:hypothetical protein
MKKAKQRDWLKEFHDYANQKEKFLQNELKAFEYMEVANDNRYVIDMNDLARMKAIRAQLTLLNEMQLAIPPISGTPIKASK